MYKTTLRATVFSILAVLSAHSVAKAEGKPEVTVLEAQAAPTSEAEKAAVRAYVEYVYRSYSASLHSARLFDRAISAFVKAPTAETLQAAKESWLKARDDYGLTEAFRFYDGPIDGVDPSTGKEGPEGRLNSWPVNEAYIDYVKGDPKSGVVNDPSAVIDAKHLVDLNQKKDEADVSVGWHAAEFLLWGQDFDANGPGKRPLTDFTAESREAKARKTYLTTVSHLIVADLTELVKQWSPDGGHNYAAKMLAQDPKLALSHVLTGLVTLSGFELAGERIGAALDSGDQEDEHSCFSDNTHNDIVANARGVELAFDSIAKLGLATHPKLTKQVQEKLRHSVELALALHRPFDQILAAGAGSPEREVAEKLVASLSEQTRLLQRFAGALGLSAELKTD